MSLACTSMGGSPVPLPKDIRVESSASRAKVWERLTKKEKKLAYHLMQAGRVGRSLLYLQSHRHALAVRDLLFASLAGSHFQDTQALLGDTGFREWLLYGAKFLDQNGPYDGSNRKYVLKVVTEEQVLELLRIYAPQTDPQALTEIAALLTKPEFELQQKPESDTDKLELTGGNQYAPGIRTEEVKAVLDKTLFPSLNCRIVRSTDGLACDKSTVKSPGVVGESLRKIVKSLRLAKAYACTDHQKAQIEYLIRYFTDGDLQDFRKFNIEWVKDGAKSPVDFMMGWVEVYEDWLARIGTWESYVQIVDPQVSKIAGALASHAQYFEDAMPYGEFKKKFPADYSPPAIMVYYLQEISSYRTGGYNLPNFDDIRRTVGAKNVIRLPLPGESEDPAFKALYVEALNEFMPSTKIEAVLNGREKAWQNLVLMHEIIGHGSGTYDETKYPDQSDPISMLGQLGSALEEQRADQTALVFAGDPKLIEIGIFKTAEEAKHYRNLTYDYYLADFLRRVSRQRNFSEAHQRGHWLLVHRLLSRGIAAWVAKDGASPVTPENQVLTVVDYDKFHAESVVLLGELQRIKAVRDDAGLKKLFEEEAPLDDIQLPWAQAIIQRGANLKINSGYIEQPWLMTAEGNVKIMGGTTLESIAPFWKIFYGE